MMADRTSRRTLAVDVGLNGLGWARWDDFDAGRGGRPLVPDAVGVIEAPRSVRAAARDYALRGQWMMSELIDAGAWSDEIANLALEWPNFRAGDAVGHAAASGDSLGVLYMMCGMLVEHARLNGVAPRLVTVAEWKGQLPKPVVARRLAAAVGVEDRLGNRIESHAWDAVGIGLHSLGVSINSPLMAPAASKKKGGGRG